LSEEADLLIEAVSLLGQRQQELDAWAAERERASDERLVAVEERQAEFERRLAALEQRVAQLDDGEHGGPAGGPEDRLERLRQQVEELRGAAVQIDEAAPESDVLPAPEPAPVAAPAPARAAAVASSAPTTVAQPSVGVWQRLEQMPRNRLDMLLLVLGAVVVLYAGLWQIALALGFS